MVVGVVSGEDCEMVGGGGGAGVVLKVGIYEPSKTNMVWILLT